MAEFVHKTNQEDTSMCSDPFERALKVARKLGDKRRTDEANKRSDEEKRKLAEREKERTIDAQASKINAWFRSAQAHKVDEILSELGLESKIPLGRIRLTT